MRYLRFFRKETKVDYLDLIVVGKDRLTFDDERMGLMGTMSSYVRGHKTPNQGV